MKTENTKEKYKENQERLKKEILRIENLKLNSRGSLRFLKSLNDSLKLGFEEWKRFEDGKQNIKGVKLYDK